MILTNKSAMRICVDGVLTNNTITLNHLLNNTTNNAYDAS